MKRQICTICFLLAAIWLFIFGTNSYADWEKIFGGEGGNAFGRSVRQTTDGGYIIAGEKYSFGVSEWDVYLVKTDASGNLQWQKTFGGADNDYGWSVQQTTDGGYIIAGYTYSSGAGSCDIYLLKVDASGNLDWEKTFGGAISDHGYSVQQTADGGYIIAGDTRSFGAGENDAFLVKTDASGNPDWEKTFGGASFDYGYSVQQTTDGGYIIAGYTYSSGAGNCDAYLINTDASGNLNWEKTFGGANSDYGYSVQQTSDDGYIIAGYTKSSGAGRDDAYLVKTDASGNLDWEKTFGGTDNDRGYSVQQTSDDGYIIAGYTKSSGAGEEDAYLVKTDASGNLDWEKTFGGFVSDFTYTAQQASDSGYIIAGDTRSFGAGEDDAYLAKIDASGSLQWQKTFGGTVWKIGYSVQQATDGGYISAGYTYSFNTGDSNFYLLKTDSNGNFQWDKTYGGAGWDTGWSIQQTTDGGYIIAGYTYSFGAGNSDFYLVKTDSNGNFQWDKTYGGADWDIGWSVQQTLDGGYIITGYTYALASTSDVYLVKADSNGNFQWDKRYGGTGWDIGWSAQQTSDGGYIITGYTYSSGADNSDVYLIKTDSNGNSEWEKTFGGTNNDHGLSVLQASDGGYIIVGDTYSFGAGKSDVYLVKADSSGNFQWEKTFGGIENDFGLSFQQTVDGGYIIVGNTNSFGAGRSDVYLVKTDFNGNFQWDQTYGQSYDNYSYSVRQTKDGGYIAAGYIYSSGAAGLYLVRKDPDTLTTDIALKSGWNMISFPGIPSNPSLDALIPQGSNIIAPFYTYSPTSFSYKEISEVKPGEGYWALSLADESLSANIAPVPSMILKLKPGWNMIGGVDVPVNFLDPMDNPDGSVIPPIYTYNPASFGYVEKANMEPEIGYWVLALQDCTLTLNANAAPAKNSISNASRTIKPEWIVPIRIVSGKFIKEVSLGVGATASDGFDPYIDKAMPPRTSMLSTQPEASFKIDNNGIVNSLISDIRKDEKNVVWTMNIESQNDDVELSWNSSSIPSERDLLLQCEGSLIDMRVQKVIKISSGKHILVFLLREKPAEPELLQNYPNPFNPETWIPYQLSKPGKVTISIYDVEGRLVKELNLGHKEAGIYTNKERAVHWDGMNEAGEKVSSGVYFYSIKTDDFTSTKKLVIVR